MSQERTENSGLWASFVSSTSQNDFRAINLNQDLFNKMVVPACFKQCSKTDIDIVFLNEMECAYKCMITYKQAFTLMKDLERQWTLHIKGCSLVAITHQSVMGNAMMQSVYLNNNLTIQRHMKLIINIILIINYIKKWRCSIIACIVKFVLNEFLMDGIQHRELSEPSVGLNQSLGRDLHGWYVRLWFKGLNLKSELLCASPIIVELFGNWRLSENTLGRLYLSVGVPVVLLPKWRYTLQVWFSLRGESRVQRVGNSSVDVQKSVWKIVLFVKKSRELFRLIERILSCVVHQ